MPPVKIDPRLVPGKDHFRPFRLATAENINGETLHRVHVVFSFTRSALICSGEVGKEMRSQIEEEEVPRSFFAHCSAAVEPLRVVDGGGVVVAVTRVDGEAVEIGNGSEWIVGRNPHQLAESVIDRGKVFEAALALNGFKKVIDGDVQSTEIAVVLEEVTTGA